MVPSAFINLVEFDRAILKPAAHQFSRALSERTRAQSFAELVSGYFWLLFGLDAEYFPEQHAESLFRQRFGQFVSQFKPFYQRWGYVFDSEFEPLLIAAANFGRPKQRPVTLSEDGKCISRGAIRSALIAEERLRRYPEARKLMTFISFGYQNLQPMVVSNEPVIFSEEGMVDQDEVVRGFQELISYMQTIRELSQCLVREQPEGIGRLCDLRIRQLTRWRVNRHFGIDRFFGDLAVFVSRKVMNGVHTEIHIRSEIDALLNDWGFTHVKSNMSRSGAR